MLQKAIQIILRHKTLLLFLAICIVGLYLRFWQIENVLKFNYDQGRDAWEVRRVIRGEFPLKGPRTGIGDFYLGPAYFYILAPFYFLSGMDPMGANYLTIVLTFITFVALFLATKEIFNQKTAFIALAIYALSHHAIELRTPWNVTFVPLLCILLIYSSWKVLKQDYKYILAAALIIGFFFHIHFTAIFLPLIFTPTLLFVKNKKKILKWVFLSIPLFLIWFIPTLVDNYLNYFDNYYRTFNFFHTFLIGFHPRFLLYRLPDSLVQIAATLYFRALNPLSFLIPILFSVIVIKFEKDKVRKILCLLLLLYFVVPLLGFSVFAGHVTDYYYLINLPSTILIFAYLLEKLTSLKFAPLSMLITFLLAFYFAQNIKPHLQKPTDGGLKQQKEEVKQAIETGNTLGYKEGDIKSYLYTIWVLDKQRP